ncbi:hypothetical protein PF010_g12783 [Phytophthora fragariae]|uniref:Tc1-like transposase DDE domain-containing protein n=1 Tax=Phytophthora fragariae TaxID=53985 RepID=A0A6A3ER66_9STRA|nr:hypothetical protein PF003_g17061 [Phytophthora fragariae]KAE8936014.1 hypothetical protein PF009_g14056 [Phytophthora fragariae]KAE9106002.1 hypothetical protein PF010_g12783 [Phytophthora fragariae]KAE9141289.1 hypothetical protein PF006_g13241 [Phytophthora fragariae]KAE9223482.1 hypothetical protein PF002_g14960 [Phytophthora fragariae]
MAYTVKQTRIEPTTCNKLFNKTKRQIFARALKKHQQDGDCIVYFDESNFNVYCKRGRGRAKKGTRATLVLPPSNGANLQVQCAVNSVMGVVLYKLEGFAWSRTPGLSTASTGRSRHRESPH